MHLTDPPPETAPQIFSEVEFFLVRSLPIVTLGYLRGLLLERGGFEAGDVKGATHVISSSDHFTGSDEVNGVIVTPTWVGRSVFLNKLQDPRYFSADPRNIFSGIVATSHSGLSVKDKDTIAAGITSLGGEWKHASDSEVTHVFCPAVNELEYGRSSQLDDPENPMRVRVIPGWFFDCFTTRILLPTKKYLSSKPRALNPGFGETNIEATIQNEDEPEALLRHRLLRLAIGDDPELDSNSGVQPSPSRRRVSMLNQVFSGKRVVFSVHATGGDRTLDEMYRHRVEQLGGTYISGLSLGGEQVPTHVLEGADIFVTSFRDNQEYSQANNCKLIIGTPAWTLHISSTRIWSSPEQNLLHYPHPKRAAPGFGGQMITITNYSGGPREYLKKLIVALGGTFTPSLIYKNTCLIASHVTLPSDLTKHNKVSKAREWGIPVVNHLWLEDCFREWEWVRTSDEKYSNFPQGYDWMQEIDDRGFVESGHH